MIERAVAKQEVGKKKRSMKDFFLSKQVVPYVFVAPFVLSFLLLFLYPLVSGIILSFQSVLPGQKTFIGLDNYERIFNPTFFKALSNTTIYVVLTTGILTIVPIILAIVLNSKFTRFADLFRAAIFIPALTSTIVAGVIFRLMFGESEDGLANTVIGFFGMDPVDWKFGAVSGMFLMVLLCSWKWMGVNILYFMAGLANVPRELYEAADMDGAGVLHKFRHITLPLLKPITIYVITISIIHGFRMYEESYVFWQDSSPGNIGLTIVGYIYQQGFRMNDMGFGAAVGVVLMMIIFIISIIQLTIFGTFKKGE